MDVIVNAFGYFNVNNLQLSRIADKETTPARALDKLELLQKRKKLIGSKCQTFFEADPFVVSRASMQYLYDEEGQQFIDCISNVQHVGHCHPVVVQSIAQQLATSTCNVRFVSAKLTDCAEELLRTLTPGSGLDTILFCNSGSEANDLALRLARDFTGHEDVVVLEHAYHGHVTTTMQMSPYKFDHDGSAVRRPDWVHVAPVPDVYRGRYRLADAERDDSLKLAGCGERYAADVARLVGGDRRFAAFIAEALQSCGGQVIPPPHFFRDVTRAMHAAGALMIIDEVQTGFGRVGDGRFWAHQMYSDEFTPDIVTMGKPMGNGFPVAAVVTRREIANRLGGSVGYFNTYGGNPVACAAVLGVLEVIQDEHLLDHVQRMGQLFQQRLTELRDAHECVGDVRGVGMFWGVDLVRSRETREPATQLAADAVLRLRQHHCVLLSADGPHSNTLKFKPPLCFDEQDLREAVDALDRVLGELSGSANCEEAYASDQRSSV